MLAVPAVPIVRAAILIKRMSERYIKSPENVSFQGVEGVEKVDTLRQNQDFDELGQKNKARFLRARFALQILEIWAFPRRK